MRKINSPEELYEFLADLSDALFDDGEHMIGFQVKKTINLLKDIEEEKRGKAIIESVLMEEEDANQN